MKNLTNLRKQGSAIMARSVKYASLKKAFLAAGLLLTGAGSVFGQSFNLDQASNGKFSDNPRVVAWQNGNLNYQNSHFLETYSVPYRATITGLTNGTTYTVIIGYDVRVGSKMALDFLTSTQRLESHAQFNHPAETINPLLGLSSSFLNNMSGAIDTEPIDAPSSSGSPVAGEPAAYFNSLPGSEREMKLYGGNITALAYDGAQGSLSAAASESRVYVTFVAGGANAVLTWGANIAGEAYWGVGRSAKNISGSPYHMRLKGYKTGTYSSNASAYTSLGNTDRSLKTDAIIQAPTCSLNDDAAEVCGSGSATFTVSASGGAGGPYTYSWTGPGGYTASTASITVSAAGTYTATVKDKINLSSSGCSAVLTVTPDATAGVDDITPLCQGANNTTVFSVTGTYSNGTPMWSVTGGALSDETYSNGIATATVTVTGAGPASVTLTTTSTNSNCPNASDSEDAVVNARPGEPALSFVYPDCSRALMQITVTSPTGQDYEYRNQGGAWQSSNVFEVAPGTGYSIEARNINTPACISDAASCPAPQARKAAPQKVERALNAEVEKAELQVYPNPFTMNSTLQFKVAKAGRAVVEVYDLNGHLVNRVYSAKVDAGIPYQVSLDGSKYADGVYFTRLTVDGQMVKSLRIVHHK